ncbi:MAG: hypothetical protein JWM95_4619 [Gemmatimonadetes bacterium]|nr:hypothetical protein [Gemmatimonadota bacterium]
MSKRTTGGLMAVLAFAGVSLSAGAQDPRMTPKLDNPSKAAVQAIVDSAKAQGVPTDPLLDKVKEGLARGADNAHIVAVVRNLSVELANAQRVLGANASADEIKAGAYALHAGVPAVELGKLKKESGRLRSLANAFTVMADIVSRGVPVGTATNAIRSLVGAGAKDKDINDFQQKVKVDIDQGAPPAAAAETRAKPAPVKPEDRE